MSLDPECTINRRGNPRYWPRAGRPPARRLVGATLLLRAPVGREPLERPVVDVDAPVPAREQAKAEVAAAREPDVGEQAVVAVARVLRRIPAQHDPHVPGEALRRGGRRRGAAGPDLGRVDPDQPHGRGTDLDGVAVDDASDGGCAGRRRQREQGDQRGEDEARAHVVTVGIFSGPQWVVHGTNSTLNANAQALVQQALNQLGGSFGL